jgi:hypothetical protein
MGGPQTGRSPVQRAVGPITVGMVIPICLTDTAAVRIIIVLTTATHTVAIMTIGIAAIGRTRSAGLEPCTGDLVRRQNI